MKSQIDLIKQSIKSLEYQHYGFKELIKIRWLVEGAKQFYEIDNSLDSTIINIIDINLTKLIYLHSNTSFEKSLSKSEINEEEILIELKYAAEKL